MNFIIKFSIPTSYLNIINLWSWWVLSRYLILHFFTEFFLLTHTCWVWSNCAIYFWIAVSGVHQFYFIDLICKFAPIMKIFLIFLKLKFLISYLLKILFFGFFSWHGPTSWPTWFNSPMNPSLPWKSCFSYNSPPASSRKLVDLYLYFLFCILHFMFMFVFWIQVYIERGAFPATANLALAGIRSV